MIHDGKKVVAREEAEHELAMTDARELRDARDVCSIGETTFWFQPVEYAL